MTNFRRTSNMDTQLIPAVWHRSIYLSRWTDEHVGSLEVREPATGGLLDIVGLASRHHVSEAADAAVSAQRQWANTAPGARAAILRRAASLFEERKSEIL